MSARLRESKATTAKHAEMLRAMLKRPENKVCVDCKRNDPRWASTNIGAFLCIRCSGIHRGLGVHISRVRSVDLDTWTPEQIANMDRWGNLKANLYWEAHLKPGHQPPEHKMEQFIRSKYESKRWAMEGPMPDPATLGDASEAVPVPAASTTPSQAAPPAIRRQQPTAIDLLGGAFGSDSTTSSAAKSSPSVGYPSPPSARATPTSAAPPARKAPASEPAKPAVNNNGLFDLDFSGSASANADRAAATSNAKKNTSDIMSLFGSAPIASPPVQAATVSSGLDAFSSLNLGGPSTTTSFSSFGQQPTYQQPVPATTSNYTTSSAAPTMYVAPSSTTASQSSYGHRPASNSISSANPWATPATTTAPPASTSNNSFSPSASGASASNSSFAAPSSYSYIQPTSSTSNTNNFSSPPVPASSNMDFFNSQDIWGSSGASTTGKTSNDGGFGGFSSATTANKAGGFDDLWS